VSPASSGSDGVISEYHISIVSDHRSSTPTRWASAFMQVAVPPGPRPGLADALEEAGCDDADVHAHCRGPGPHVRGCWVVDLIIGKS